ncbi:MAG TPA: MarR family transcriptional regulator [Kofleriaceae bacterium]|nr:MarR family transcriptional regulator [Kofleriaceae bacterium]
MKTQQVQRTETKSDPPLEPPLAFLQRLWRLNQALELLSARMERSLGITAQQRLVLRCIGRSPKVTPGQLAELLHLDPGTISAAIKRLGAKGLIERTKDETDSRRALLTLSKVGRRLDIANSDGTVEGCVRTLLAETSPAKLRTLAVTIDRLTELLDATAP